jgi:hypothetical protein
MPAYPFFILSTIFAYETSIPLSQEITSQGYCYQLFIHYYLVKNGVLSSDVDTYVNFLTELSFCLFKKKQEVLYPEDFDDFMEQYLEMYNLPIQEDTLLQNLSGIISTSFNNYSFKHMYFYYYFVAKYLSENMEESQEDRINIMNNLHTDENAYVAIFLSYHSKDTRILEEIGDIAYTLFDKYEPATLSKNEMEFFGLCRKPT